MPPPSDRNFALGKALRRARARAGLTQTQLAEALGITFQQIQKYEKGTNRVHVWRLVDLCETVGTTPEKILAEARDLAEQEAGQETAPDDSAALRLISLANRVDARTREAVIALLRARARADDVD